MAAQSETETCSEEEYLVFRKKVDRRKIKKKKKFLINLHYNKQSGIVIQCYSTKQDVMLYKLMSYNTW